MHHDFAYFKEFNAAELEDVIHEHFHVLLTGHVHRSKNATFLTHQEGIFHSTSAACLVSGTDSTNLGYTSFELDAETDEVRVTVSRVVDHAVRHDAPVTIAIPIRGVKQEQNELRKTIRKKYGQELLSANDLLIDDGGGKASFLDLFTEPALLRKSSLDTMSSGSRGHRVSLSSLTFTTDAFLVIGKDKSGRTSLLKKIHLDLLHEFSQQGLLPYYVDFRTLQGETRPFNLVRRLSEYYEMSQARAKAAMERYGVKLLLDNYHVADGSMNGELQRLLEENPLVTFLATAEESLARNYESFEFGNRQHTNLFLHNITRSDVRLLAKKWPNLPVDKRDEIIDKVDKLCRQLNLPLNYWTVSLFMWVFERNLGSKIQNNVELIQLYVDGMLDRERMIINRSEKIGFEDFKLYVSSVAHFLLTEHFKRGYACSWLELTQFTGKYIQENKKFVIGNEKVVRLMLDRGIVKEVAPDLYSFRLNGVFEYFLALYMNDHPEFRREIFENERLYLSFGNELELYAGFNRLDEEFIRNLLARTREIYRGVNERMGIGASVDANLRAKVESANNLIPGLLNNPAGDRALSDEEKDQLMDDVRPIDVQTAEVERKRFYEGLEEDSEVLEQALRILARAYRASAIRSEALQNEVFDFVLDSACNLGFILIEETEAWRAEMELKRGEEFGRTVLQMMTNFIPLLVQTFLNDWLAQPNLERIFNERIVALKENAGTNQYKLTMLYLLLMDIDVRAIERRLPEAQQVIHERGLRFTVLLKLYFYLMFKSTPSSPLEKFLVGAIEKEQMNLNPHYDKRKLKQMLADRLRQKRGGQG